MWRLFLSKATKLKRKVFYNAGISYRQPQAKNWRNYLAYDD